MSDHKTVPFDKKGLYLKIVKTNESLKKHIDEHGYGFLTDAIHDLVGLRQAAIDNKADDLEEIEAAIRTMLNELQHFLRNEVIYTIVNKNNVPYMGDLSFSGGNCVFLFTSMERAENMIKSDNLADADLHAVEVAQRKFVNNQFYDIRKDFFARLCALNVVRLMIDSFNGSSKVAVNMSDFINAESIEAIPNRRVNGALHKFIQNRNCEVGISSHYGNQLFDAMKDPTQMAYVHCSDTGELFIHHDKEGEIKAVFAFLNPANASPLKGSDDKHPVQLATVTFDQLANIMHKVPVCVEPFSIGILFQEDFAKAYETYEK